MIFKYNEKVDVKELCDLRQAVGWNRMEKELSNPRLRSFYHIAVYESEDLGQKLVGFVDCVSNGVTDAYIQDLMVHPDFQGKGIGTELMNKMIEYLKEAGIYMISVLYDEELKVFYSRFGFYNMLCGQLETYRSL
jgi:ribosomal protein S18 acetylase RimI-like enzyme